MKDDDQSSAGKLSSRASGPQDTDIPGYKRMDFPERSQVYFRRDGR